MQVIAIDNQTLLDIAVQTTGNAVNFLKIALENNLVPTAPIAPGTVITIPVNVEKKEAIIRYYLENNVVSATALNEALSNAELTCEEKLYECFKD
jgi:hypothetical protein